MCAVIRKRFRGEREKGHRDELCERLVHIEKQLDLGLDHLRKQGSEMSAAYFEPMKEAYEALSETLSEVESLQISRWFWISSCAFSCPRRPLLHLESSIDLYGHYVIPAISLLRYSW